MRLRNLAKSKHKAQLIETLQHGVIGRLGSVLAQQEAGKAPDVDPVVRSIQNSHYAGMTGSLRFTRNPAYADEWDRTAEETSKKCLPKLQDYLRANRVATNSEQKIFYDLQENQAKVGDFKKRVDSIIDGYLETEFHTALVRYIQELELKKMAQSEVELIQSKVFKNREETRTLQDIVQALIDTNQIQANEPADSDYPQLVPRGR